MKKKEAIRSVPVEVNEAVREYSVREDCPLNQAVLDAPRKGSGAGTEKIVHHDLDFMAGTWISDEECEAALEQFNRIDEEMWKVAGSTPFGLSSGTTLVEEMTQNDYGQNDFFRSRCNESSCP